MPAETYNLAHLLLSRAATGSVFVPIRSMQYLAVIDREEFIFVDREGGRTIDIAWRRIDPTGRPALDAPVPYEAVYYTLSATHTMARLQGEFQKALSMFRDRQPAPASAHIIPLGRPPS